MSNKFIQESQDFNLVYQSVNDISPNVVPPTCGVSVDTRTKTTTDVTINSGDVVIIEFEDNITT